jgi:hypothetical protein
MPTILDSEGFVLLFGYFDDLRNFGIRPGLNGAFGSREPIEEVCCGYGKFILFVPSPECWDVLASENINDVRHGVGKGKVSTEMEKVCAEKGQ